MREIFMHDDEAERMARRMQAAAVDREDLLAILAMRFGSVPSGVRERIEACQDLEAIERLVLVAANVPTWEVFLAELDGKGDDFKVVGARFDPLSESPSSRSPGVGASGGRPAARDEVDPRPETHLIQIQQRSKEH